MPDLDLPRLELIGGTASNYVWVCRILLEEKGVPYTHVAVMPHTPDVDAIHPLGKVPVMRHGDVTLCESKAICHYIERVFHGPTLTPDDTVEVAQMEQWISIVNTAIDPLWVRTYFREYVFPTGPNGTANREAIATALPRMKPQFDMLNCAVAGGHLVGSRFTLADAFLIPILYYMSKSPEASDLLADATHLDAYLRRHMDRPSVKATVPPHRPGTARAA